MRRTTIGNTTIHQSGASGRPESPQSRGTQVLDRLIGDALVGAMIVLGLAFCLGAARAGTAPRPALSVDLQRGLGVEPGPQPGASR